MRVSSGDRLVWATFLFLAVVAFAGSGCSRTRYRLQADRDAYDVIAERNCDPRWTAEGYSIETDPRSRYFDAYDPDRSPMPPDDPTSNTYMRLVDGKKGWKHWLDNGERPELENAGWSNALAEYVEIGEEGDVKLDVDSALRLAYVHSPEHQRQLETLYLSALDVTEERFRLDTQFFGGYDTRYTHNGSLIPAGLGFSPLLRRFVLTPKINAPAAENNRLTLGRPTGANPALQARRRFSTAGELLVGFANSFVFEFTGGDVNLAASLANFSLVQPLLRGAGKDIALEQLTQAERTLLANLRAYVQFRQGFYTQIAIGELGVTGPQRGGSSTSLQSFSGVGGVNGYVGLLQQRQQIRNAEDNLSLQLRTRDRLEALYDNELIGLVQVDQFRQGVETQRSQLLGSKNSLELAIENYKTGTLGLPPDLPVELDRSMIRQFQLLPPEANEILEPLFALQKRVGDLAELAALIGDAAELQDQLGVLPDNDDAEAIDRTLGDFLNLVETIESRLDTLRVDLTQMESGRGPNPVALTNAEEELVRLVGDRLREAPDNLKQHFEDGRSQLEYLIEELSEETDDNAVNEDSIMLMFDLLRLSQGCILIQSHARRLDQEPQKILADAVEFIEPVRQLFDAAKEDLTRMDAAVPTREQTMTEREKEDYRNDREQLHKKLTELKRGELGFDPAEDTLIRLRDGLTVDTRGQTLRGVTAWVQMFLQVVERLSLVPARARLEIITVDSIDLDADEAFQIALANRLDFMNGRAALVDRWRLLEVNADALQSVLNITASGDVRTAKNNIVSFRAPTSTVRLGLEFDAPFTRLLERNTYRESLIEYQRSRRAFIQSRDSLQLGLRAILRNLELRRQQLKIQRRAVTIALRRVDQTQLELTAPRAIGQRIDSTTATNLLSAQGSLQSSQNAFLAAWLSYYASRLRLYRELGVMVLDSEGRWLEFPIEGSSRAIEGSGEGGGLDGDDLSLPPLPAVIRADWTGRANVSQTSEPTSSRAGHSTAYQPPSPRQISPTAADPAEAEFKMPETRD